MKELELYRKPREQNMIKYLATIGLSLIFSVAFLCYLILNPNFVPNGAGGLAWINILLFFLLLLIILVCILNLVIFGIRKLFFRELPNGIQIKRSIRYSLELTLGILIVYLLHFYHVLSFWWGVGILIVVILALFVI